MKKPSAIWPRAFFIGLVRDDSRLQMCLRRLRFELISGKSGESSEVPPLRFASVGKWVVASVVAGCLSDLDESS